MRRPTLLALTLALSLLGIADAWYLAEHALTNTALACGIGIHSLSGCNTVAQSAYSHFFGIPLGVYGVVFYAAVFIVAALLYRKPQQRLSKILLILSILGTLFSIYFVSIQLFVIKAICIYCFGSFFISIGILAASLSLMRSRTPLPPAM